VGLPIVVTGKAIKKNVRRIFMSEIKSGDNEFFIEEAGEAVAKIEFTTTGKDVDGRDLIAVTHTFVDEKLRGQGVGEDLVKRVVDYARAEGKYIIPQCPYAKHVFDENKEYQDVLA
jgi:uncharacterized protein